MRVFMQIPPQADRPGRFYQLILQEDLLGGWTVIRQWGINGQRGSQRMEYFDDFQQAQQALMQHREKQLKDGFSVTFLQGEEAQR